MKKVIIGITGGLASGKTTLAKILAEKGAKVIDADLVSHQVLELEVIQKKVVEKLGKNILSDNKIDRKLLGKRVFSDKKSLKDLCSILHPEIIKKIKTEAEAEKNKKLKLLVKKEEQHFHFLLL